MAVTHAFTNPKADGPDTTIVRPSDWNADHDHPPFVLQLIATGGTAYSTSPASGTNELGANGAWRWEYDLRQASSLRLVAMISDVGPAASQLRLQYDSGGATWVTILTTGNLEVATDALGFTDSGWGTIAVGAQMDDALLRLVTVAGDGTAMAFRYAQLQVR